MSDAPVAISATSCLSVPATSCAAAGLYWQRLAVTGTDRRAHLLERAWNEHQPHAMMDVA